MLEDELKRLREDAATGGEEAYERYVIFCERLKIRPGFFYWSVQYGEAFTPRRGKSSTREGAVEGLKRAIGLGCTPSRYISTKGSPAQQLAYVHLVDALGEAEAARWRGKFARRNGRRKVEESYLGPYNSRARLADTEQLYAPAEGVWELGP